MKPYYMNLYQGDGKSPKERPKTLPAYQTITGNDDPANYLASPGLRDAVNVALTLGQPLLITGEPGTGKTRLAASIAWESGLNYLEFHTKTDSEAKDLFYFYDALRRFQDAQLQESKPIEAYITCQALGTAILLANPTEQARKILPAHLHNKGPCRSVVLIDEIDKAPRDLPNDVLNEIESMTFRISETSWEPFSAVPNLQPVILLTSNSEKNLPDAFLRRCIFFHIDFPDADTLKRIVQRRFQNTDDQAPAFSAEFINGAIEHFEALRRLNLRKKPATAEFLAWICILKAMRTDMSALTQKQRAKLELSYSVLAKSVEDLKEIKRHLNLVLKGS